jgi:hypothetical protein
MNAKVLLLGAVVAAFSFTSFAADALLTPRAAGNQPRAAGSPAVTPVIAVGYVDSTPALLLPRAEGNQIKIVKGVASDRNPALECRSNMNGSPKAVAACSQSVTMPGCQKLASLK